MSISVTKIVSLPQAALKFLVEDEDESVHDPVHKKTIGGVFTDANYAWLARGSRLEIIHTKTGAKIGAWSFGWVLKDSTTKVVCVDEIQRPHGRLPLLAVALDCDFNGGMICIFDFLASKIIRAIHLKDKITNLHVIDSGYDIFTLPGPLRNFDGVIAVGAAGGDVLLIDICRQICDEALTAGGLSEIRDELNPCELFYISLRDLSRIEHHKEFAIRNSHHLAIHLNVVEKSTNHFALKGPKGEDRLHVNKDEVRVSALYYCPQLGSLLVGYNFGALQLYNLMNLDLIYTSPVCDEHIPISHFAIQEPADDPRSVCYVWAVYSSDEDYPSCLPLAVMYAFCYHTKEYHDGYGFLYQDFSNAAVHFQMELGIPDGHKKISKIRGGTCLKLNSITHGVVNREGLPHDSNEDMLTLSIFVWNVFYSNKESHTFVAVFDLNQWYKEQMPSVMNIQFSSTYMIHIYLNDLINSASNKSTPILNVSVDKNSIQQYMGAQRLEEHFYPNSLSFGLTCVRDVDVIFLHNYGVQKALLAQIESLGPLCLVESAEIYQEIIGLGLVPLFIDLPINSPISSNQQREIILGTALENQLMGWLCKCASEWANGSFLSAGCSLDFLISWAFHRAITLKTNCDKFCVSLFDYSQLRLDNNTNILLTSCTRQLKNLCSLYGFIINKLSVHISNRELVLEQHKSLETVSVYFEVLQWLLNVGLLPECPINSYPRTDDLERISAPYPAEMLIEFYNHRRALLKILNEEYFSSSESVLFIDALIEQECGGKTLQEQWRNDGGNGLYPPPSLQALLRTYLIDNVDLSYKHLVIIYVFLDLAMTLDQDKYKPVITHLIKFPAVFKVSPSIIKITQAFWQLDHGDYNTAMGLLLDPLITPEDLTNWHHKIVLRSLILQKQHNFALLYVQVRKPVINDDEDILSILSLYIANDMLDEAFYLGKQLSGDSGQNKFMAHFFNECKKNDKLRSLIYRSLASKDENFFLKYLTSDKQPSSEDLHVYYHILRSHFIEAFESHERSVPTQIENQGLFGQENAAPRDKLVFSLKKLLPDVNKNLLSLCHKEKNNAWQKMSRPTPLSVFVHNLTENVNYKSTIIGAALAKAKQTFIETVDKKFKMDTEGTPFLRTPTVSVGSRRSSAVIVNPKIINIDQEPSDLSPPPEKRLKLSPKSYSPLPSKLDTPLVKRKTPKLRDSVDGSKTVTPQSILKVKRLVNHMPSRSDGQFEDDFKEFEKIEYTPVGTTSKKSGLGLSPRKSLAKHSPVVRFEGLKSSSSSSLNNTRSFSESPLMNSKLGNSTTRLSGSSKNTSTEEEIFYSPDASLEEKEATIEICIEEGSKEGDKESEHKNNEISVDSEAKEDISEEKQSSPLFSPKARRSYKRSLGSSTPARSSPRLSKSAPSIKESPVPTTEQLESSYSNSFAENNKKEEVLPIETTEENKSPLEESPKSSPLLPKLRPRKSLCRKVLETNALNRAFNSPVDSPRSRRSTKVDTRTEESTEQVTVESNRKFDDGEEVHRLSFTEKHISTTSLVETDIDTSDFSFECSNTEDLKFSDSMMEYLDRSNRSFARNKSILQQSISEANLSKNKLNEINESLHDEDRLEDNESLILRNETLDDQKSPKNGRNMLNDSSQVAEKSVIVDESGVRNNTDKVQLRAEFDLVSSTTESLAHSVFDSSGEPFSMSYEASEPKLSESMLRCINNREIELDNLDSTQHDEQMEVDDDIVVTGESKEVQLNCADETVELVYEDLTSSKLTKDDAIELGSLAVETSGKKAKDSFDAGSTSNAPVDPEMNVFEITDDLSFNDGLVIEKEVQFEEDDLCYDQQSTLESVLEENMCSVSPTPLTALEKNVFNESSEESNDGNQDDPLVDEEEINTKIHEDAENEVIEIGSSSEEDKSSRNSSRSDSRNSFEHGSNGEKLDVSYERHIYDSESDYSSQSSYERRYSEISGLSEDEPNDKTEEGCGLFEGDIILIEENRENETSEAEQKGKEMEVRERPDTIHNNKIENRAQVVDEELQSEQSRKEQSAGSDEEMNSEKEENGSQLENTEILKVNEEKKHNLENISVEMEDLQYSVHTEDDPEDVIRSDFAEEKTEGAVDIQKEEQHKEIEDGSIRKVASKDQSQDKVKENAIMESDPADTVEETKNTEQEVTQGKEEIQESKTLEQTSTEKEVEMTQESDVTEQDLVENVQVSQETRETGKDEVEEKDKIDSSEKIEGTDEKDIDLENNTQNTETAKEDTLQNATLENNTQNTETAKEDTLQNATLKNKRGKTSRTRSSSVSSSKSTGRRPTRRTADDPLETALNTPQKEPDVLEDLLKTQKPVRSLRSRTLSTEEVSTPTVTLRKRSASVDQIEPKEEESLNKEEKVKQNRKRRASSVLHLPKIPEEDGIKNKKSNSVLEGYTLNRRVTRRQLSLLQKVDDGKTNLDSMDPIVLLDKLPFDGKPDPEEQKVYDTSPSTTNSATSTPIKTSRRLRSTSQASDTSQRSKSKTPVRAVKRSTRSKSTDEVSNKSLSASKKLSDIIEDVEQSTSRTRVTRSRTKSVSSMNSDDSKASENTKTGKRRRRVGSQSTLPEIKEEPVKTAETTIPKKRTRKNSSQM